MQFRSEALFAFTNVSAVAVCVALNLTVVSYLLATLIIPLAVGLYLYGRLRTSHEIACSALFVCSLATSVLFVLLAGSEQLLDRDKYLLPVFAVNGAGSHITNAALAAMYGATLAIVDLALYSLITCVLAQLKRSSLLR